MLFKQGHKKIQGSGMRLGRKSANLHAWERIGQYLIEEGADRYLKIINDLADDKFLVVYAEMPVKLKLDV